MSGAWYKGKKVEETDFSDGTFDVDGQKFTPSGGGGSSDAADVDITDVGGYYSATDVEGALQEAAASVGSLPTEAESQSFSIAMAVAL